MRWFQAVVSAVTGLLIALLSAGIAPYPGWTATACLLGVITVLTMPPAAVSKLEKRKEEQFARDLKTALQGRPPVVLPPSVITPPQKQVPLPVIPAEDFADRMRLLQSALRGEDGELAKLRRARNPGPSPEAQAALSADLLDYLQDEAEEYGAPGSHWEMSAAWLAEVKRVHRPSGGPLFIPRVRTAKWQTDGTLLGYPVHVREDYGAPTLVA